MNTWNYRDCINTNWVDGRTLNFLRHKWKNPNEADMYQTVSDEEMSYQSYEMICRLLYGLTIAQLREHQREDVDSVIEKHKIGWLKVFNNTVAIQDKLEIDWGNETWYHSTHIIGTFILPKHMVTVTVPDFV